MSVIAQAKMYNIRPSEVLYIKDEYTAYCFNEACTNFMLHIKNKEKPDYTRVKKKKVQNKHYSNFTSMYNDLK